MKRNQIFTFSTSLFFFLSPLLLHAQKEDSLNKKVPAEASAQYVVQATSAKEEESLKIFEKVDVEASVNLEKWRRQLEKHLQAPIEKAAKKGMKAGQYTVNVRFIVEKDGSISDVKALNDPGYGLAEASEKVVRTGPRWNPGEQNGRKVRSYHTQPVIFIISEK